MTPEDRQALIAEVVAAIQPRPASLSDDEQRWVRMAIQREAQSYRLRQAIIEKTLSGLVWAAIVAVGLMVLDYAKNHGFKP
ncbi:MAG: hypothetical protein IV107_24185 [Paucibacter sp.]|nr:hypothetical protein [Roseateles sp.]